MACEFICDGCGKREPVEATENGDWFKPWHWYTRTSIKTGKTWVACSRACVEKVNEKSEEQRGYLPI